MVTRVSILEAAQVILRGGGKTVVPTRAGALLGQMLAVGGMMLVMISASHADAISPRRLVEVADIGQPVVSPDGESVAFRVEQASVERNDYDSAWYVQRMDGTSPALRVTDGGVPLRDSAGISLPAVAVWSPDGRWIYYRAFLDGRIDVWRAAADGSGSAPLTLDPADVRDFRLSADGRALSYSTGATREEVVAAEQAEYESGTRIDGEVPIGQGLFRSGFTYGRLATQRFGKVWFDRASLLAAAPNRWKAVNLIDGSRQDLPPSEVPFEPLGVSEFPSELPRPWKLAHEPRHGRIALLTRVGERNGLRDKPDAELAMLPRVKFRSPVRCQAELCTRKAITDIQWRPGGDEVLFTVTDPNEGLAQSIFRWNAETGAVHPVVRSRGLISGGRDSSSPCGLSARALACVAAEADGPPRLERIDIESGERQVLFNPNTALAYDMKQVPVQLLRWTDARGRSFTGQYFPARRKGNSRPPLFVSYYRCLGFLRGGMGDEWPLASLAEHGISALCVNAAPYRIDALERYDSGLSATESAIDLLAARGEVDAMKVGFGGLSFGSEVAFWLATESRALAAVSVSSPVISPNYYLFNLMKGESFFSGLKEYWQLGTPEETPERWRAISPTFKLDRIAAPILFQMSEQEYLHSLDYSVPLLRDGRADVWVYPNEPHQKFQPKHKLVVYERNLDWFRFWLQEFKDNDSRKAEQYKQWRIMREHQCEREAGEGDTVPWYCQPS